MSIKDAGDYLNKPQNKYASFVKSFPINAGKWKKPVKKQNITYGKYISSRDDRMSNLKVGQVNKSVIQEK